MHMMTSSYRYCTAKALQGVHILNNNNNNMTACMLTCPRAGPRGGDGEAFPAGTRTLRVPMILATPLVALLAMA